MRIHRIFLSSLVIVNAVSIFGYATFSRNTQLLLQYPWAQPIFESSYRVFARLQIILAFVAMVSLLGARVKAKWIPACLAALFISFLSEFSGTSWGLPFGSYEYTDLLGPMILNRVPYLIPLSWFFMGTASYALSLAVFENRSFSLARVLLGAWILVSWDLTLDPAMSHLAPFWTWNEAGPYFGTPLLNLFGWYMTGLAILVAYELLHVRNWISSIPSQYFLWFYGANLLLPLGIVAAAGLWEAIVISIVCYSAVGGIFLMIKVFRGSSYREAYFPLK